MFSRQYLETIYRFLKLDERRPVLVHTRTTQQADILEADFNKAMLKLLTAMKNKSTLQVQKQLGDHVKTIVQSYVEDAYLLGKDYSNRALGKNTAISIQDVNKIQEITHNFLTQFWQQLHQNPPASRPEAVDDTLVRILNTISAIIAQTVIAAVNMATKITLQANPLELAPGLSLTGDISGPGQRIIVEFVTRRDERVCPYCEPLDGRRYELHDYDLPDPPIHFNCRCRLLAVISDRLFVG